jgi:hypothetical protein
MSKISSEDLEMGIASFIEKRGYAGLRVELTPQQALDIYTERQLLREVAKAGNECLKQWYEFGQIVDGETLDDFESANAKWEQL